MSEDQGGSPPRYRPGPMGRRPLGGAPSHPDPATGFPDPATGVPAPSPAAAPAEPPPELLALGENIWPEAGSSLFRKGDPADHCWFVLEGQIVIYSGNASGTEVEFSRIRPGDWFGEAILFSAPAFPVSAKAGEDGASLLRFSREGILDAVSRSALAASYFISLLARKCLSLNRRLDELTIMPARQRLARFLSRLCQGKSCAAGASAAPCLIRLPAKKREIASELAMAPETFSRTVKALEDEGIISLSARSVSILDCVRLHREAEG